MKKTEIRTKCILFSVHTLFVCLLFTHGAVSGAEVVYKFTATGSGGVAQGYLGYDEESTDWNIGDPTEGLYESGFLEVAVTGGLQNGVSVKLNGLKIQVSNGLGAEAFDGVSVVMSPTGWSFQGIGAIDDDRLPGNLDLSRYIRARLDLMISGIRRVYMIETLTRVEHPVDDVT